MLKKIRNFWYGLSPKNEKFKRKSSSRFSSRKFRIHRIGSRKYNNNSRGTRRMDSYQQLTMNVNESTIDENAKGCDKNPVSSTRSLSGHCSTSTTQFSYYNQEIINTSEKLIDEREIDGNFETRSTKKVVEDRTKCQSASISCSPSNDEISVFSQTKIKHLHILKKSSRIKIDNLRLFYITYIYNFFVHQI